MLQMLALRTRVRRGWAGANDKGGQKEVRGEGKRGRRQEGEEGGRGERREGRRLGGSGNTDQPACRCHGSKFSGFSCWWKRTTPAGIDSMLKPSESDFAFVV